MAVPTIGLRLMCEILELLKLNANLVPTSSKSTQNFFCYFVSHTGLEQVISAMANQLESFG
jgi:hypothetical protein